MGVGTGTASGKQGEIGFLVFNDDSRGNFGSIGSTGNGVGLATTFFHISKHFGEVISVGADGASCSRGCNEVGSMVVGQKI